MQEPEKLEIEPKENIESSDIEKPLLNKNDSIENGSSLGEDESCDNGNDNEDEDNYGSSGEKYGWYNGFSDDAIDDAFEGDPEVTWNVD